MVVTCGWDFWESYIDNLKKVTPEEIRFPVGDISACVLQVKEKRDSDILHFIQRVFSERECVVFATPIIIDKPNISHSFCINQKDVSSEEIKKWIENAGYDCELTSF